MCRYPCVHYAVPSKQNSTVPTDCQVRYIIWTQERVATPEQCSTHVHEDSPGAVPLDIFTQVNQYQAWSFDKMQRVELKRAVLVHGSVFSLRACAVSFSCVACGVASCIAHRKVRKQVSLAIGLYSVRRAPSPFGPLLLCALPDNAGVVPYRRTFAFPSARGSKC